MYTERATVTGWLHITELTSAQPSLPTEANPKKGATFARNQAGRLVSTMCTIG